MSTTVRESMLESFKRSLLTETAVTMRCSEPGASKVKHELYITPGKCTIDKKKKNAIDGATAIIFDKSYNKLDSGYLDTENITEIDIYIVTSKYIMIVGLNHGGYTIITNDHNDVTSILGAKSNVFVTGKYLIVADHVIVGHKWVMRVHTFNMTASELLDITIYESDILTTFFQDELGGVYYGFKESESKCFKMTAISDYTVYRSRPANSSGTIVLNPTDLFAIPNGTVQISSKCILVKWSKTEYRMLTRSLSLLLKLFNMYDAVITTCGLIALTKDGVIELYSTVKTAIRVGTIPARRFSLLHKVTFDTVTATEFNSGETHVVS